MGDPVILQRGTVVTIGADGRRTTRPFEDADRAGRQRPAATPHNLGAGAAAQSAGAIGRALRNREAAAGYKNGGLVCTPKSRKL